MTLLPHLGLLQRGAALGLLALACTACTARNGANFNLSQPALNYKLGNLLCWPERLGSAKRQCSHFSYVDGQSKDSGAVHRADLNAFFVKRCCRSALQFVQFFL